MKWNERFDSMNSSEKNEFRRLANYLLTHTYLVRDVFRPEKQWTEPSSDFRMVSRHFDTFQEYFAVSGWRLEKDDDYGVISLSNEYDHNRTRLDRFTTLFLYTCRLMYEEGREQGDNRQIVRTDTASIVEKMRTLGLLTRGKTTQKERLDAQRTLAHFNIIQKMETTAWNAQGNGVLILPSILSIIPNHAINDMAKELDELSSEVGEPEENEEEEA